MDKTIAEPLAFIVFSAWPLALLAVLVLGIFAVSVVVRRTRTRQKKWVVGLITSVVVILIPTWDVIAGHIQFSYLCATESGIKINKRVTLDTEYRDVQFPDNHLVYDQMPLSKRYPYSLESSEKISGPGKIKYSREVIRDAQTGETLGTFTSYFWGGGWFENTFSLQGAGGGGCGYESGGFQSLLGQIFGASH